MKNKKTFAIISLLELLKKGQVYYIILTQYFKDTNFDFDRCEKVGIDKDGNIIYDAYLIPEDEVCPFCGSTSVLKNGHTKVTIKHTPYFTRLIKVKLHLQNYKCKDCGKVFREYNPFSMLNESISIESIRSILEQLLDPCATFSSVAKNNHLDRQDVINIFERYIDYPEIPNLPDILSFDEKHINKKLTCNAYTFVMLDFRTKKLVDLVVSRHKDKLRNYFKLFPKNVRDKVKYVTIDMWPTYRDIVLEFFKNAKIAIDSFHVMKAVNNALDKVRISVMQKYNKKTENIEDNHPYYYVLKKFRHYLTAERDNLPDYNFYVSKLRGYYNRDSIVRYMTDIDEKLKEGYELVRDYREFNNTCRYKNCESEINELIERFYTIGIQSFQDVGDTLSTWKEYIINSFIELDDCFDNEGKARRLSNGPIEGTNLTLAQINLNGHGYENFWRFRNRCLFVINKDKSQIQTLIRKKPLPKIKKKNNKKKRK